MTQVTAQELTGQSFTVPLDDGSTISQFKLNEEHQISINDILVYKIDEEDPLSNKTIITEQIYCIVLNKIRKLITNCNSSEKFMAIIRSDNKLELYSFISGRSVPKKRVFSDILDIYFYHNYIYLLKYDNTVYYCCLLNYKNEQRMNINSHEYTQLEFQLPITRIMEFDSYLVFQTDNPNIIYYMLYECHINQVQMPNGIQIKDIYSMSDFYVLLSTTNQIFVSGTNLDNPFGFDSTDIRNIVNCMLVPNLSNIMKVVHAVDTLFVILKDGSVYAVGCNVNYGLGIVDYHNKHVNIFTEVNIPKECKCINIFTNNSYTIFLTESGQLFYCGTNCHIIKSIQKPIPTIVENVPEPIVDVYNCSHHSVTLFKSASGQLYIAGIVQPTDIYIDSMIKINIPEEPDYVVDYVECKKRYCIIVLNNGNIYFSGSFNYLDTDSFQTFIRLDY